MMKLTKNTKLTLLVITSLAVLNGCGVLAAGTAAGVATSVATDPRPTEIQAQDNAIKLRLDKKYTFTNSKGIKNADIAVTVYNGAALLTGWAPNAQVRNKAETLARAQQGVRSVYNEINIGKAANGSQSVKDTWITTQVKSKLLVTKGINSDDIKVVTANNNVYLLGVVTPDEAQLAANTAASIQGVKHVKKGFTLRGKVNNRV